MSIHRLHPPPLASPPLYPGTTHSFGPFVCADRIPGDHSTQDHDTKYAAALLGVTLPVNQRGFLRLRMRVTSDGGGTWDGSGTVFEIRNSNGRLRIMVGGTGVWLQIQPDGVSWDKHLTQSLTNEFTEESSQNGMSWTFEMTFDTTTRHDTNGVSPRTIKPDGSVVNLGPYSMYGRYPPSGNPSVCYSGSGGSGAWEVRPLRPARVHEEEDAPMKTD